MKKSGQRPDYALVFTKGEVATIYFALLEHAKRMPDGDKVRALAHKIERQAGSSAYTEDELIYGSLTLIQGYKINEVKKKK